jgi:hypothetical protein
MMESEHESAGDALAKIREITRNYEVPEYACVTFRALMSGLMNSSATCICISTWRTTSCSPVRRSLKAHRGNPVYGPGATP